MRLDDQQRRVRGPSHETKDDVESQEEPVIGVVVGQASRVCSNLHFPSTEAYLSIDVRIFILEVNNVGMSSSGQLTDIVWPKAHTITHTVSTDNLVWPKFLHPTSPS